MNDFEREVLERLTKIEENIKGINKRIYGNGQPGLDDKVIALDKRVVVIESKQEGKRSVIKDTANVIAWLVATTIGLFALFKK